MGWRARGGGGGGCGVSCAGIPRKGPRACTFGVTMIYNRLWFESRQYGLTMGRRTITILGGIWFCWSADLTARRAAIGSPLPSPRIAGGDPYKAGCMRDLCDWMPQPLIIPPLGDTTHAGQCECVPYSLRASEADTAGRHIPARQDQCLALREKKKKREKKPKKRRIHYDVATVPPNNTCPRILARREKGLTWILVNSDSHRITGAPSRPESRRVSCCSILRFYVGEC